MFQIPPNGNGCPFCGRVITLELLRRNNVEQRRKFFCPDCGTRMYYILVDYATGKKLFLNPVDDKYNKTLELNLKEVNE